MLQQVIPHFFTNYDFLKIWQYVTLVSVVIERGQTSRCLKLAKRINLNEVFPVHPSKRQKVKD